MAQVEPAIGAVWEDPRVARGMEAQLELRRRRLEEGDTAIGWKVAFGARDVFERLGLPGPAVGFLTSRSLVEPGSVHSLAGAVKPALEPEIAVHMGRDLAGGASRAEAEAAIAALGPAIELADVDRGLDDIEGLVATDIFHRAVVLGPADRSRAGGSVEGLRARVTRDGVEVAETGEVTALTGDPVELVRHVADVLSAVGERLEAGQVVICGSVVPVLFVAPGEHVEYELAPLGRVGVRFSA